MLTAVLIGRGQGVNTHSSQAGLGGSNEQVAGYAISHPEPCLCVCCFKCCVGLSAKCVTLLLCHAVVCDLQVGAHLQDVAPSGLHSVFERFRAILHEGAIDKRCQYMIEGLFAVRKVRAQGGGTEGGTQGING